MATDNWGHETIEVDGKKVMMHYYSEDDGWGFMKSGAKRSLIVEIYEPKMAEVAIRESGMLPKVIEKLLEQLKAGRTQLSYFVDNGFAWSEKKK
jgi:hypothetical protein